MNSKGYGLCFALLVGCGGGGGAGDLSASHEDLASVSDLLSGDDASADLRVPPAAHLSFGTAVPLSAGASVDFVALADFNGDGRLDIVVTNRMSPTFNVLLATGPGTFGAPTPTTTTGTQCWGVAAGDVTQDGKADIVLSCGGLDVYAGNGNGTFSTPSKFTMTGAQTGLRVAIADLNGDARPDVVYPNGGNGLFVALATANSSLLAQPLYTGFAATVNTFGIAVADWNSDHKVDVIVSDQFTNGMPSGGGGDFAPGDGDGTFGTPSALVPSSGAGVVLGVAAGDFNGDGKMDVAFTDDSATVLAGNGNGTFGSPLAPTSLGGGQGQEAVAADFDGDGKLDLVVPVYQGASPGNIAILRGKGDGTFDSAITKAAGMSPEQVAVGDLNGDGRPDIVVSSGDAVQIILNTSM